MTLVTITFNNQVTYFLNLEAYALHTGACSCSESSGQSLTQCWVSKNWGPAMKNSRQIISKLSGPEFAFYQTNRVFPTTPMSLSFLRPPPWSSRVPTHYLIYFSCLIFPIQPQSEKGSPQWYLKFPLTFARCHCCACFMLLWRSWTVAASSGSQELDGLPAHLQDPFC